MAESALQLVAEIGAQLCRRTRSGKDSILKSLKQVANAFSEIELPSLQGDKNLEATKRLEVAIKPLKKAIVQGLLQHKDKEVRLLVAICISEIFRVTAPELPFEDENLRDIFELMISTFAELDDTTSPFFSRRVKILETVAGCKCCVIMLDVDCNDLVLQMFSIFFSVVRENHPPSLNTNIISIMTHILNEETSQTVLDVILQNLVKEEKGEASASRKLAVSVIQRCADKLEPLVCGFLTTCILDRDAVENELKEFYHEIIFELFKFAPQMLLAVIPNLTQELLTDQVDVRIKAVNLIGKLFALPGQHVAQHYPGLLAEFLKRFSDKSVEVRVTALQCVKAFYMGNPSGNETEKVLTALEDRLLDFDDRVRIEAVIVACDLAQSNIKFVPLKLISKVTERLRDKKISVRKKALHKLMKVYQNYCDECSKDHMTISEPFEQIPSNILMLCYDKDCKEFRYQNMELVLARDLFPALLSVEERTIHWIHLFSLFNSLHLKAFNSILYQKRRLQTELQIYLALRKTEKESSSEEIQKKIKASILKMAAFFPDPSKAEESLHKLNQMKDNNTFNSLQLLLDELTITDAQTIRDKFLKTIGDRHPQFEFFCSLSSKCSCNIFGSEHIRCILDYLSRTGSGEEKLEASGEKELEASSANLLLAIISIFPSLLRGWEKKLQELIKRDNQVTVKLIEVLAKAGPHISVEFSDIYPILKRVCLEGSRLQAKFAVAAMAALASVSEQSFFSVLWKELMDSLQSGRNIPTVLQSLSCIAQYSVSTFECQEGEITSYIYEKIFQADASDNLNSFDDTSCCSNSCKLKIYGLKTLVKSFLPHQATHVRRKITEVLDILTKILQNGGAFDGIISCDSDKAYIRLAAAKSVLQLSKRWDLHISPETFCSTILMAKDSSSFVRRLFLDKTHKLLKGRATATRYACAFALATSDCLKDLQDISFKYMAEFVKEYSRDVQIRQASSVQGVITDHPSYIVVFLTYLLAHDTGFPDENCKDEKVYAQFCSPLLHLLETLVRATENGNRDLVNDAPLLLLSIFRAIKKAEDVVDTQKTPKLHILADIGFSFVSALNHNGVFSSPAPALILLPSSFYRVNSGCPTQSSFDDCFLKKIVHMFKSCVSLPVSSLPKYGKKSQEYNTQSKIFKKDTLNLAHGMQLDLSTTGTETQKNVRQDVVVGHKRKQVVSVTASDSVGLRECSSINHLHGASKESATNLEKELLSSSDSVTPLPSVAESNLSIQVLERNSPSYREKVRDSSSIVAETSNYLGVKLKDPLNIISDSSEAEVLCLESESCETAGDGLLVEKENVLSEKSKTFQLQPRGGGKHFCHSSQKKAVDAIGDVATRQQKVSPVKECQILSGRTILPPAKAKKGRKASNDTSEVTNLNDNTVLRRSKRKKT